MRSGFAALAATAAAILLFGCASQGAAPRAASDPPAKSSVPRYQPPADPIRRPTVPIPACRPRSPAPPSIDGEGGRIENGTVVLADGRIQAVGGPDTPIPEGATRIDGRGRWVTPGRDRRPLASRRLSEPRASTPIRTATR